MATTKVEELFANKQFVDELLALETPEAVQAKFKEEGIDLTIDEVKTIGRGLAKQVRAQVRAQMSDSDELDEEDLEDVAGGFDVMSLIGQGMEIYKALSNPSTYAIDKILGGMGLGSMSRILTSLFPSW